LTPPDPRLKGLVYKRFQPLSLSSEKSVSNCAFQIQLLRRYASGDGDLPSLTMMSLQIVYWVLSHMLTSGCGTMLAARQKAGRYTMTPPDPTKTVSERRLVSNSFNP
jgi:hypothetical protein